jgi:hypothetical protein
MAQMLVFVLIITSGTARPVSMLLTVPRWLFPIGQTTESMLAIVTLDLYGIHKSKVAYLTVQQSSMQLRTMVLINASVLMNTNGMVLPVFRKLTVLSLITRWLLAMELVPACALMDTIGMDHLFPVSSTAQQLIIQMELIMAILTASAVINTIGTSLFAYSTVQK